jgi:hypothetical protein
LFSGVSPYGARQRRSAQPPRPVVLHTRRDRVQDPGLSGAASGASALDEFIADRHVDVARFGLLRVLAPK